MPTRRRSRFHVGLALAVWSGTLLYFSFPPFQVGWLAFVALVPFWIARYRCAATPREAGFFAALPWVVWLVPTLWNLWPGEWWPRLLPLGVGLAASGLTTMLARRDLGPRRHFILEAAAGLTALEGLRQLTPLGLGLSLALTQHRNPGTLQIASLVGPWGITFLVILTNAAVAKALVTRGTAWRGSAAAILVVIAAVGWGRWRLNSPLETYPLTVATVQPGVPSPSEPETLGEKYDGIRDALVREDFEASSLAYLERLGKRTSAIRDAGGADLYVWPEGILQGDPGDYPALDAEITGIARRAGAFLTIPYFSPHPGASLHYNMLAVYDPLGTMVGEYRKQRPSFGAEYSAGPADQDPIPVTRHGKTIRLGPLICFDFDFTGPARAMVLKGAQLLVAPSDDGYAAIARWHPALIPVLAASNQVAAVKADTAYGSVVVDGLGRILAETDVTGIQDTSLRVPGVPVPREPGTLYTRLGDWFFWICGACFVVLRFRRGRRRRSR